jgi:hypothetical protein
MSARDASPPDATNATYARVGARTRRDWKPAFLKGFAKSGTVADGCKHAGIHKATAYRARHRDEAFALKWADLEDDLTERIESKAVEMALSGECRMIEFLLKARRPDVYNRDRHVLEHTGPDGGPVKLDHDGDALGDLSKLSERDLASLQRILTRAHAES